MTTLDGGLSGSAWAQRRGVGAIRPAAVAFALGEGGCASHCSGGWLPCGGWSNSPASRRLRNLSRSARLYLRYRLPGRRRVGSSQPRACQRRTVAGDTLNSLATWAGVSSSSLANVSTFICVELANLTELIFCRASSTAERGATASFIVCQADRACLVCQPVPWWYAVAHHGTRQNGVNVIDQNRSTEKAPASARPARPDRCEGTDSTHGGLRRVPS